MKLAMCPCCGKQTKTFVWGRQRIYVTHGAGIAEGTSCEASGWLVEDEELIA